MSSDSDYSDHSDHQIVSVFSSSGDSDSDHDDRPRLDDIIISNPTSGADSDTDNSDMPESEDHFFEGVEKLLEVWFTKSDGKTQNCDLRMIPREKIKGLLRVVKCEIINMLSNECMDSYVLSESSLFVSKKRFILKTCGTTTPLLCMKNLLVLVKKYAGFDEVEDVFYSRKNYKKPELQRSPHRHFDQEVDLLDTFFHDGSAYCLGSVNRDCWYLYTVNSLGNRMQHCRGNLEPDQTLEVLMTELDPSVMRIFTKEVCKSGQEATLKSGIDRIIPNALINEHLFDPCGYSMNGIFKNGSYMTIHITPEEEFSYVSFETNASQCSYKDVIGRVLDTFRPGKFVVTVFANKASSAYNSHAEIDRLVAIKEWLRMESQFCRFKNYDLTYALYTKFPS
ncbi:S-adenosylmethionine decarboxylase proenzyme isoform X2 [Folsomia candida]|uniref:S-adenosylmethionine decarboxylase proenzyme isoform X2 n=1 Tax=Folsomia candida TaxID=158441 RepID=UPI000B8F45F5|nr:S-adenosylmethionine decarboxylase proenzyme isoform X2 [Folsomia candida]